MTQATCAANIGWEAGEFGFVPSRCDQPATGTYTSKGGLLIGYCDAMGHENRVRRVWAERETAEIPEPEWLHEMPEYADPITAAKAEAERYESWTLAATDWEVAS